MYFFLIFLTFLIFFKMRLIQTGCKANTQWIKESNIDPKMKTNYLDKDESIIIYII